MNYFLLNWQHKCTAWAVMYGDRRVNGNGVHRLGNVMTIEVNLHVLFDYLGLWFKITVRHYLTTIC